MKLRITWRVFFVSLLLLSSSCGSGVQTVCGIPFSDNGAGAVVDLHDVNPLPESSFKVIDGNTWQLEQGGFYSNADPTCQFGVKDGHIYQR